MPGSLSRRLLVLATTLAAMGAAAACANDAAGPSAPAASPGLDAGTAAAPAYGYVLCSPQPYAFAAALIGPGGGTIKVNKHQLTIPKGALNRLTLITMEAPSDTIVQVAFGPEGLRFNAGAEPELKLDYKG